VKLIERVQSVGRRLIAAQPREMVVGNIVRRVLGLIREEAEGDHDAEFALSEAGSESLPQTPRGFDGQSRYSDMPQDNNSPSMNRFITTFGPRCPPPRCG